MSKTLSPSDARELLQRVLWFARRDGFDVPGSEPDPADRFSAPPAHFRFDSAKMELLRGAVTLAEYACDVSLLPLVIQALHAYRRVATHYDDRDQNELFASAIQNLLQMGAAVTDEVRALAEVPDAAIRLALVRGLRDAPAEFEALLRGMADDTDAEVRAAVKTALAGIGAPPWWIGLFGQDPALVISDEDAPRLGPKLARWAEILGQSFLQAPEREELYAILDELPDGLARDAAVRLLTADRGYHDAAVIGRRLGRAPGSIEEVIRLVREIRDYRYEQFTSAYAACDGVCTEAASRRVFHALFSLPVADRQDISDDGWRLVRLAEQLWPEGADPTDLVDQVIAELGPNPTLSYRDFQTTTIDQLAAKSPTCVRAWSARAVQGWLGGQERGLWRRMWNLRDAVLAALELEERREIARQALASPDDEVVSWALRQLTGPAHDPDRDPPLPELVAAFVTDPRLRGLVARETSLVQANRDLMRRLLHEGRLDLAAASSVLDDLASYGELMRDAYMGQAWEGEEPRWSHLAELPPREPPALTAEDWAAWRQVRSADAPPGALHRALFALPLGPLSPEDRAFVDGCLALARDGHDRVELGCAVALMVAGTVDDIPWLERVVRDDPDNVVADLLERMKTRLGVTPPRTRGKPGRPPANRDPKEWMDEED